MTWWSLDEVFPSSDDICRPKNNVFGSSYHISRSLDTWRCKDGGFRSDVFTFLDICRSGWSQAKGKWGVLKRGTEKWVYIYDNASSLHPCNSIFQLSSKKTPFSAEFDQCATAVKGLTIKDACFCRVLFVDAGGLVNCWDCFGFLLLSDRGTILQCLDRFYCVTVINVASTEKVSIWPQEIVLLFFTEEDKTKFIVWLLSGQSRFSLGELNSKLHHRKQR